MRDKLNEFYNYLLGERGYAENTVGAYRMDLEDFLTFLDGDGKLKDRDVGDVVKNINHRDIRGWFSQRSDRNVSNRSNARALSALKSFLKFLKKKYNLSNEFIHSIRGSKFNKNLPSNPSHNNILKMLQCVDIFDRRDWEVRRDKAIIILIYGCGLRISEALNLRYGNFIEKDRIKIRGKGSKERIIYVLPIVLEFLENYRKVCPYADGDFIFFGSRGKHYQPATFEKLIQKIRNLLGLSDNITPHSLRHAFATELLSNGADLRSIQELLGHAGLGTTQIYTHVDRTLLLKTYEKTHPLSIGEEDED